MKTIKIGKKTISEDSDTFIIAEAGVNYYDIAPKLGISLLEAAILMIKEAARAGADAIKFQTYKAEKIASKYSPAYWDTTKESTKSQYELFKKFDKLTEKDYKELADYSDKEGIIFMSTPFDEDAVDLLDKLTPVFKIASADITNTPFLRYIASKRKPIILSTGAATLDEVREAVEAMKGEGNNEIVILHCILNYPTAYENANIGAIRQLQKEFPDHLVGYSDHTLPDERMLVNTVGVLAGASVIEKHFTLDKSLPGNDHYHAMDAEDLKKLRENLDFLKKIWGRGKKEPLKSENISRKYARRSLVAKSDIPSGATIKAGMVTHKRPGTGISPKDISKALGMKAKKKIKEDEVLKWEHLKK